MLDSQLLGREQVVLDAKYRLAVPARHREALTQICAEQLVLTEHPDGFLLLMPLPKWQNFSAQFLNANSASQWLKRIILGGACPLTLDSAKRLLLPQELRAAAGIEREVLLLGVGDYFELWNPSDYEARRGQQRSARTQVQAEQEALQSSLQEVKW